MLEEIRNKKSVRYFIDIWSIYRVINEMKSIDYNHLVSYLRLKIDRDTCIDTVIFILTQTSIAIVEESTLCCNIHDLSIDQLKNKINTKILEKLTTDEDIESYVKNGIKYDVDKSMYYMKFVDIAFRFSFLRDLFIETGLYNESNGKLFISNQYIEYFKPRSHTTLEEFLEIKKNQSLIGELGENYVLEFEKKRLKNHSKISDIKRISEYDVGAGYDIVSFMEMSSEKPNRYIEVKAHSGSNRFYWSKNEINVSKQLTNEYFVYLVDIRKIDDNSYAPIMIQNPHHVIFESDEWIIETETISVTKL